jgi:hypothetical protein
MIPLINYGEIVTDAHCLAYGAALLGMMEEEYYRALCAMSDWLGAEPRLDGSGGCGGAPDSAATGAPAAGCSAE